MEIDDPCHIAILYSSNGSTFGFVVLIIIDVWPILKECCRAGGAELEKTKPWAAFFATRSKRRALNKS